MRKYTVASPSVSSHYSHHIITAILTTRFMLNLRAISLTTEDDKTSETDSLSSWQSRLRFESEVVISIPHEPLDLYGPIV